MAEEKPIEKMTVKELRALAKELGAEGVSGMQKEELIRFILQVRGKPGGPGGEKVVKIGKRTVNVTAVKRQIRQLKAERKKLLSEGKKEEARKLRERISRLKKLTRKVHKILSQQKKAQR
jgi:protein-arginine kinase activator protein McsA